jgi:hypothetical protein
VRSNAVSSSSGRPGVKCLLVTKYCTLRRRNLSGLEESGAAGLLSFLGERLQLFVLAVPVGEGSQVLL